MSTPARKPLANTTNSVGRRNAAENTPIRPVITPVLASTGQGLARTPSARQNRPARKFASRSSTSFSADVSGDEDETKASNAQLVAELKEQVQKAEQASEHYRKQLEILQARFDEISGDTTAAEERAQQHQAKVEELQFMLKDSARQKRESEQEHEAEKTLLLQERERRVRKEEELQSVIQRLNETIRQKGKDRMSMSRSASIQNSLAALEGSASPTSSTHANKESSDGLLQRDQMIDALRLELVEAQIKLAERDHQGDGRLQELEKALMETKMINARLTEDNESFQYLLSEKTLKGDFMHETPIPENGAGLSSLAEELESVGDGTEVQPEAFKKLEAENKGLKDANKALTLYVDKIIGRILQHEGFEDIITGFGKDDPPPPPAKFSSIEKALPPPPDQGVSGTTPVTFLQRARSVVQRPTVTKARPQSVLAAPTANENPDTAPSIPLNRGHRRARSDQEKTDMAAAAVVAQMNRGSPLRTVSGGPLSPGISPQLQPVRGSYFQHGQPTAGRAPSGGAATTNRGSSANSVTSDHSGEKDSTTDNSSAQTSSHGANNIPGAVMKQNQLRPLRLVRDQLSNEENDAQKKANRGSWMGWFKGASLEGQNDFQS